MKRALLASTMAAAVLGAAVLGVSAIAAPTTNASVPERADNFQLTDHKRLAHELHYFKDAKAIVLMTQINGTTVSRKAAADLEKLQAKYAGKGVLFYMLNSKDSRDAAAAEAKAQGFDIPVLVDELQLVGESLGVQREGEVFVVEPKSGFKIAYHGPVAETAKALDAIVAGQPVAKSRVEVKSGAPITFAERGKAAEHANISYSDEIAPILQAKCVTCHQKGGIAPFAMDSYEIVKTMAPMIRESVRAERMPPYFADPHIGSFQNDQGMTADQTKTLIHWLEAGAPRGTGRDALKEDASEAPEWPAYLGKPDVIVDLPAFDVAASGLIEYQNMRVENPFKEDAWLRAISIKPGDRTVLHHVVSNHVADPKLPRSKVPGGSVGSYTPGAEAQVIAKDAGAPVPAGGKLNFQMHYTTTGKAATDRTQVGFYTLKAPPKFIKRSTVIGDFGLKIPAGAARHEEVSYQVFPADAYIYTLYPHSHYRGFSVDLKMVTPDGKETMLLALPKYDFNWQRDYDPKEPILVKKGTKLVARWIYDNSENNRANPDPKRDISWGEQTNEEMMYFRVNYRWADETVDNIRNDLQSQLMSSMSVGMIDDNYDGKIQETELKGMMASLKPRFKALDVDNSGDLDAKEMAASGMGRMMAPRDDIDL
jgi:peroxiredoxin